MLSTGNGDIFQTIAGSNPPHGGILKDLLFRDRNEKQELLNESAHLPSLLLNERQICDLELLLTGGFSPLEGFLGRYDYESVLHNSRLADGTLWTMPITLDVSESEISALVLSIGTRIVLRNPQDYEPLAILTVSDIYKPVKSLEAVKVYGKDDSAHPAVYYLHNVAKDWYIGGKLQAISLPAHFDNKEIRNTPRELRERFEKLNWRRIVAFQTRNPMHRAHRELTVRAARSNKCHVLIHPVVGVTKPGDIDYHTRVRVYKEIIRKYPDGMAELSLLPLAMRMAGPREAVWHAIIRKNHGCTHFIVGRDHAGPGKDSDGQDFYGPYDAQDLVNKYKDELKIQVVPFKMVSYLPDTNEYVPADEVPAGAKTQNISGTELRKRLRNGSHIPDWFTYPEVQKILRQVHPPRYKQGFAVLITGHYSIKLQTLATALESVLNQSGQRPCTLLLPDDSRRPATAQEVTNFAFIGAQVAKNGGAVIASPLISKASELQQFVTFVTEAGAGVVMVHVATSLEDCIKNDKTGFYDGTLVKFEAPKNATITVDASKQSIAEIVHEVILELEKEEYIGSR